ncbi:methyltransferase domain-containing protein [Hyphomicrobium sp. xq]|uniref:Methyltransferase domain-containing protein n=1 Tax=Hyphomicrobium album TaxID=2665159 RepID=A0A6I3KLP1_9HYPH|nr:class I SAM-dependent methyltransferase [Hyphomicrobium album]MTD94657.1 methyltransferase domain-containing protein [Hyphomicrobium album]
MSANGSLGQGAQCPVCGESKHRSVADVIDDRYGCPDLFQLVRCEGCGHLMTAPRLAEGQLGQLYSTYYPRKEVSTPSLVEEADAVQRAGAKWRRWLEGTDNQGQYLAKPNDTVLDIGAGSCLSLLEAQNLGAKAYGIEADPSVRRIADELGLNVHIGSLHDDPFPGIKFDLIVLNQVIEHIPEPHLALDVLKSRLKPNGRIVLAFPNQNSLSRRLFGTRWIHWHIPFHLHHFDLAHFRRLADRLEFDVIGHRTVTPNIWTILQILTLRHKPRRGVPSPLWISRSVREGAIGDGTTGAKVLSGTGRGAGLKKIVRTALTWSIAFWNRAIDLAGQGDSILIELRTRGRT